MNSLKQNQDKEFLNQITCTICFQFYEDPRILSCSHCFCFEPCLKSLFLNNLIHCPLCKFTTIIEDISLLPKNILATEVIEKLKKAEFTVKTNYKTICENCEKNKSIKFCKQCEISWCNNCLQSIHTLKAFQKHSLQEVSSFNNLLINYNCTQHPNKKIQYWCNKCSCLVCPECMLLEIHNNHSFIGLITASNDTKNLLQIVLNQFIETESDCYEKKKMIEQAIELQDKNYLKIIEKIEKSFEEILEFLEIHKKEICQQLERQKQIQMKKLEEQKEDIEYYLESMNLHKYLAQLIMNSQENVQILKIRNELLKYFAESTVIAQKITPMPIIDFQLNLQIQDIKKQIENLWNFSIQQNYNQVISSINNIQNNMENSSQYLYVIGYDDNDVVSSMERFDSQTNQWTDVSSLQTLRCGQKLIVLDDYLYAVGGYDGKFHLNTVEKFNPKINQWLYVSPMKSKRCNHSIVCFNKNLYAIGGFDGVNGLNSVEKYNPFLNQWNFVSSMCYARYQHDSVVLNDFIYSVGGLNLNSTEKYDPQRDQWITVSPLNDQRSFHDIGILDNCLYIIGGLNESNYLNTAERYDPRIEKWVPIASMNTERCNHAVGILNGYLYAVGGMNSITDINTVERYDPRNNTWIFVTPMNQARSDHKLVVLNGYLYAIGGNGIDTVEKYDPSIEQWEFVESMNHKRISIEAIVI